MKPHIRKAAAVVLWRRDPARPEVLWCHRPDSMACSGGAWAFPGGAWDERDGDLHDTAVREVGEEVSVALRTTDLVPLARWVTPEYSNIRFDTRYFLAEAPPDAEPTAQRDEVAAVEWIAPERALERWQRAEVLIPEPVRRTLKVLGADAGGVHDAVARCEAASATDPEGLHTEITPGFRVLPVRTPTVPPATHTNCVVVGDRELVVIDPATPFPDEQRKLATCLEQLAEQGRRPVEILLTHHHIDHIGAVTFLRKRFGLEVAAHRKTAACVAPAFEVRRFLDDGDTVVLDAETEQERTLQAIHTPGHAPGHLVFWDSASRVLVAGDMIASIGWIIVSPPEGDMRLYLASLARMKALNPWVMLPAHGGVISDPPTRIDRYVEHRLARERKVVAALDAAHAPKGARVEDLLPIAYDDTPASLFPLAAQSLLAHLLKLADEGRAREVGPGRWSAP